MARKAKKISWWDSAAERWAEVDPAFKQRWARRFRRGVIGVAALGVAVYGLLQLEAHVLDNGLSEAPPRMIIMRDRPAHTVEATDAVLVKFAKVPWMSPTLCKDIATALAAIPWVKEVRSVHRYADRRIEVDCTYRRPAALVQQGATFYLVDEDAVRLPGEYANDPRYFIIQGAAARAPKPGRAWPGEDVPAALAVIRLLHAEPYREQITGVLVDNYGGRQDPRRPHVLLATDRGGGRIVWGSAPGREIEENTIAAKLGLLRSNFERFGRVDANREVIDISVYPDRIIAPERVRG